MIAGVYYSTTLYYDGNNYYTHRTFGKYINEYANHFKKVILFSPVTTSKRNNINQSYKIEKKIEIIHLPYYNSYISSVTKKRRFKKVINKHINRVDFLHFRYPSPFGYFFYKWNIYNKPLMIQVVGDPYSIVKHGNKYKGLIKFLLLIYIKFDEHRISKMVRKGIPVFVNGEQLFKKYNRTNKNVYLVRSSTILKKEILNQEVNKKHYKGNILFVGYLRHEKGLQYLLKALEMLKSNGMEMKLTIVGDGPEKNNIMNMVNELNLGSQVVFKGHINDENTLSALYNQADIFVQPSISEGTPRVLTEAMSHGTIVVASDVGGIPTIVSNEENGLLFKPKDPKDLMDKIIMLNDNANFRHKLITNSYNFAKENTLEEYIENKVNTTLTIYNKKVSR